ncbi:MAG: ATP-binding protein [Elainellaceae cyanobacterium]
MDVIQQRERLVVPSKLTALNPIQNWFSKFCVQNEGRYPWLVKQRDRLNLALAEGFTNAVRHAHRGLPPETPIEIGLTLREDWIEIRIWDCGRPFNPEVLKEPQPGTLQAGGYGWFLLRRLTDRVSYDHYIDGRNCLQLVTYGFKHPV